MFIFLLGINLGYSEFGSNKTSAPKERQELSEAKFNINNAIDILKTKPLYLKKDIRVLDSLTYNIFNEFIEDSIYDKYTIDKQTFISCIQSISFMESAITTKKGNMPFKSSLFVYGNNIGGVKWTKGKYLTRLTTEYYNGTKYKIYSKFQYYDNMRETVNHMMKFLDNKRYTNLKKAENTEQFFYYLKEAGYFTAGNDYKWTLITYANKLKNIT